MIRIILAVVVGGGVSLVLAGLLPDLINYENAFAALMLTSATLLIGGFRISKRLYCEFVNPSHKEKKHTIIYGGESMGEQILRDILRNDEWNLSVYGIFDDRILPGLLMHGVYTLGGQEEMINHIRQYPVKLLIIAFPEIPKGDLKRLIDEVKEIRPDMDIKVLPSFHSITDDPVGVRHIRDVSYEDILGRDPVEIDIDSIKASIEGKNVLVTGAGGSIGSELVRQCAGQSPNKLIALDIDETELFYLKNEFKGTGTEVISYVGNITDEAKMDRVMNQVQPDIIFHAAAYKHVPMMESFPDEAIKVNMGGTSTLATLACKYKVDKFVMISTDKAVNPTNVMGATKRVAEEICMAKNGTCQTKFISVRFGNVLGSRGSVVPIFIDQIKNGGPVTVTDPRMKRYFMTIPEAVLLVMQAGSMGNGGEVFVLDMGEPVKILDMAKDLIRLHNLEPGKDIHIQITGLRPGEKLFEELLNAEEGVTETKHKEIFKAVCSRKMNAEELEERVYHLLNHLENGSTEYVREHLRAIVPTYSYKEINKVNGKIRVSDRSLLAG
ncbi:polysaccharide biosynthesis protein [Fodinibius salsisoli]|uniref:Polysaccharide biosynthesis protein n=1 Tax=Fodinibius salsisoli TaxID=2820877 RepID=A0ABT3PLN8_9BACT|nr:polysaccharide biosynthesis protein [Fodinibius salsisoli]